jgi:hypothetical protein
MLVVETPLTFSKLHKKSSHSERTELLFIQEPPQDFIKTAHIAGIEIPNDLCG